jgi:transmembrane 9 superfamily protein 2/4
MIRNSVSDFDSVFWGGGKEKRKGKRKEKKEAVMTCLLLRATAVAVVLCAGIAAAYLPGVAPHDYADNEAVELKVVKLTSTRTQLPYDYYDGLPFCRPKVINDKKENLGEILRGDRIANSLYTLNFRTPVTCQTLGADRTDVAPWVKGDTAEPHVCTHTYSQKDIARFVSFIKNEYRVHWEVDSMPAARARGLSPATKQPEYDIGFLLVSNPHLTSLSPFVSCPSVEI